MKTLLSDPLFLTTLPAFVVMLFVCFMDAISLDEKEKASKT